MVSLDYITSIREPFAAIVLLADAPRKFYAMHCGSQFVKAMDI